MTEYKKISESNGLPVGAIAPNFSAIDYAKNNFELQKALAYGPVVLIFYRGQWCPVCNSHLSSIEKNLDQILAKGAKVVAISPEKPALINDMVEKTNAQFTLLHDQDYRIAKAYDVLFLPKKMERLMYNTVLGASLSKAHSDDSERLPVPATFIIGQNQKIIWRHFERDYKKRSKVSDILKHLP